MKNKLLAEFFGTFWRTFGGCGSALLAAKFLATEGATPINLGIGRRFKVAELPGYLVAPVLGLLGAVLAGVAYPLVAGNPKKSG